MTVRTIARVRCDGCGLEVEKDPRTVGPHGWRRLQISWATSRKRFTRMADVCPDPMCSARAIELTRDEEPTVRLALVEESSGSGR